MKITLRVIAMFCVVLLLPARVQAQHKTFYIFGKLTDSNLVALPDVTIELRNGTHFLISEKTNAMGEYRISVSDTNPLHDILTDKRGYTLERGRMLPGRRMIWTVTPRLTDGSSPTRSGLEQSFKYREVLNADAIELTLDNVQLYIGPGRADQVVVSTDAPRPTLSVSANGKDSTYTVYDRRQAAGPATVTTSSSTGVLVVAASGGVLTLEVPASVKHMQIKGTGQTSIQVREFAGDLSIDNASGSIQLNANRGAIVVDAQHGNIDISLTNEAKLVNLLARRGSITLAVPATLSANVTADAVGGSITYDSLWDARLLTHRLALTYDFGRGFTEDSTNHFVFSPIHLGGNTPLPKDAALAALQPGTIESVPSTVHQNWFIAPSDKPVGNSSAPRATITLGTFSGNITVRRFVWPR